MKSICREGDKNIKAIHGYLALLIIFDKTFIFKLKLISTSDENVSF